MARLVCRNWQSVTVICSCVWLFAPVAKAQTTFDQAQSNIAISDDARQKFEAGVRFLQDPDGARYEEAYRTFRAAFAASPSAKILGNIGFCAMKLERDGEAIEAYTAYLQKGVDIDPEERAQILRDVQTLRHDAVQATVITNVAGATITDVRRPVRGQDVTNVYGPIAQTSVTLSLHSGRHTILVSSPGYVEQVRDNVEAFPGNNLSLRFDFKKPTSTPPPVATRAESAERPETHSHVIPWTLVGVGGAMLAAGAVTGLVTLNQFQNLEDKCPGNTCPAGFEGDRDRGQRLSRVTDVLLFGGGTVTAVGLLWVLLDSGSKGGKASVTAGEKPTFLRPSARASCSGTGCAGSVRWSF